jgi:hypothetical protein
VAGGGWHGGGGRAEFWIELGEEEEKLPATAAGAPNCISVMDSGRVEKEGEEDEVKGREGELGRGGNARNEGGRWREGKCCWITIGTETNEIIIIAF